MPRLLLSLLLLAQAAPPPVPKTVESIEVSIVNVEAVVTRHSGERVHGLTAADFEVYEDGVLQPITNFAEYAEERAAMPAPAQTATSAAAAAAAPALPPQKRTVIVFIERFFLPPFSATPFFASLKKLLHETVRPGDRAVVVSWNNGAMATQQDFTDDLDALDRGIDAVAARMGTPFRSDYDELMTEANVVDATAAEAQAFASDRGIAKVGSSIGSGEASLIAGARLLAQRAIADEKRKVRSLTALMRGIAASDDKKILLLATHRLSHFAGLEYFALVGKTMGDLEERDRNDFNAQSLTRALAAAANANGVTIYPIYPEGMATTIRSDASSPAQGRAGSAFDNEVLLNETPELQTVADATGGSTAWGAADVVKLLPRIAEDAGSYYSLAYRATKNADGKPHKIVVKTKDRSLEVRARREYALKSDVARMEDRVLATLVGTQPPAAFTVNVRLGEAKKSRKGFTVPVAVEVPIKSLTPLPEGNDVYAGSFSVYTAWGSPLGGYSDVTHQTQSYRIAARDLPRAKQSHYTFEFPMEVIGAGERVAVGVIDEASKEFALKLVELPHYRR